MSDLISRQAANKAIDDLPNCYNGYSDTYDKAYIIGVLEEVPKDGCEYWDGESGFCALQRPSDLKRGKWITKKDACGIGYQICSNCETEIQWRDRHGVILRVDMQNAPYCPYCGAKMESE